MYIETSSAALPGIDEKPGSAAEDVLHISPKTGLYISNGTELSLSSHPTTRPASLLKENYLPPDFSFPALPPCRT